MSKHTVSISVIVPAYNEEKRIGQTLKKIGEYLREHFEQFEVVVVDDGSSDETTNVAMPILRTMGASAYKLIWCRQNEGKGAAVRKGMLKAQGQIRLMCDADLSTPIECVEQLLWAVNRGARAAIGSRGLKNSVIGVHQPRYRESMGRCFNWLIRRLGLSEFRDTQCGFKLFLADAAFVGFNQLETTGFAFDVEVLARLKDNGFPIAEVPVAWSHAEQSRVHPLADSWKMFVAVLWLAWRRWLQGH